MTKALERVIAEQQNTIDGYKMREETNTHAWIRQNKQTETLVSAAFEVLDCDMPDPVSRLRHVLREQGWCLTCQCQLCECEGQYD